MITKDDIEEIRNKAMGPTRPGERNLLRSPQRVVFLHAIDIVDLVVATIQDARARGFKTNRVMFSWGIEEIRQTMYQRFFISEHNYQHLETDEIYRACAVLHDLNLIEKKQKAGVVCLVLSERLEYLVSGEHNEDL